VLLSSDQVKGNTQSERSAKRLRYSRLHAVPTISYGNMWALNHVGIYISDEHIMSDTDRVWELMKKIGICMLASWDGQELQARPMGAYVQPDEHAVFFLADARHHKEDDIKRYGKVCLAFSDTGAQNYVSVAGEAEVVVDRAKIGELWGIPAKAWWKSPDDPNIRLLKVTPVDAQYWDAPGSTVAYVKMAAAALTGSRPSMGENRKVKM
jgi:general stress protein 26